MKISSFRGDLTDISAKKEALFPTSAEMTVGSHVVHGLKCEGAVTHKTMIRVQKMQSFQSYIMLSTTTMGSQYPSNTDAVIYGLSRVISCLFTYIYTYIQGRKTGLYHFRKQTKTMSSQCIRGEVVFLFSRNVG